MSKRAPVTLRDHVAMQERVAYAMYAPEVGTVGHNPPRYYAYIGDQYVERRSRERLAAMLVKAWDANVKTGA